jgi:hypothetical protein
LIRWSGILVAAALALGPELPAGAQTRFLDGLVDVPLAPGLSSAAEGGLAFEGPEGRILIATVVAEGPSNPVLDWYATALPGLGWRPTLAQDGGLAFTRGGERLEIRPGSAAAGRSGLTFRLIASPAAVHTPQ